MIIVKDYKFYAAHRNEELDDKCRNIHGHRYGLRCHFRVERTCSYSTLFATFDEKIEPHLKEHYDHGMLIHVNDPLFATLQDHMQRTGETLKLKCFNGPTSVENLALMLFEEISAMGFALDRLEIRETDTSVVVYTEEDWIRDRQAMASHASVSTNCESTNCASTEAPNKSTYLGRQPAPANSFANRVGPAAVNDLPTHSPQ